MTLTPAPPKAGVRLCSASWGPPRRPHPPLFSLQCLRKELPAAGCCPEGEGLGVKFLQGEAPTISWVTRAPWQNPDLQPWSAASFRAPGNLLGCLFLPGHQRACEKSRGGIWRWLKHTRKCLPGPSYLNQNIMLYFSFSLSFSLFLKTGL